MDAVRLRNISILIVFMISLLLVTAARAQTSLVINSDDGPPYATDNFTGICDKIMIEAFRRIGVPLKIVRLPSERALLNADEGIDDGNYSRVEGLEKQYTNLIRVPEEITRFEFVAFSRNKGINLSGWNSLKPYNVGLVTGWKILEYNITDVKSLVMVKNGEMLFNLLKHDRADIVVYDRRQGMVLLQKLNADDIAILEPPLAVRSMYPYLNKKHKELVPLLAKTLREMKKDGTYKKIVDAVLR